MTSTDSKLAYTIKEAAAAGGVSEPIIRRALMAGSLVASYPSARPVILKAELQAWLESLPVERPGSALSETGV